MLNVQLENVVVSTDGVVNQRNSYCLPSKGCQSEFSECSKENTSTTTTTKITTTKTTTTKISSTSTVVGKCGKEYGKCPSGQCCSKYGWCGKSDDYCDTSKGCQSAFGTCTNKFEGKCGKGYGKCPSGQCCSKYGWCGTSSDYCKSGCQSEYGKCE